MRQRERPAWHRLRLDESMARKRSKIKEKAGGSKMGCSGAALRGPLNQNE